MRHMSRGGDPVLGARLRPDPSDFIYMHFTPGGLWYAIPYVLFESTMTGVKLSAMVSGLLSLSSANEWVVTTKLGKWVAQKVERRA